MNDTPRTPRLLLLGMGEMGRPYLRAAHERGWQVTVADRPGADPGTVPAGLGDGDRFLPVPGFREEHWYQAAMLQPDGYDAVLAFSEFQVVPAALVADRLGLAGPGLRAAVTCRNKAYQRAAFGRAGLAQPQFAILDDAAQARAWAESRYPVVGKPLQESGSIGVRVLAGPGELADWIGPTDPDRPFLLEEYLDGPEFSVEALVAEGEVLFTNVTAKTTTAPPACVETGHLAPAPLEDELRDRLVGLVHAAVAAVGCGSCLVHLEAKVRDGRPHVLEMAVRTPGDHLMEVVGLAHGVDLFGAAIDLAAGLRPAVPAAPPRAAASWFPTAPPGRITRIGGLAALAGAPGVERVRLHAEPGSSVAALRSSLDRLGAVVVHGDDPRQCAERLAHAQSLLTIDVEPVVAPRPS